MESKGGFLHQDKFGDELSVDPALRSICFLSDYQ